MAATSAVHSVTHPKLSVNMAPSTTTEQNFRANLSSFGGQEGLPTTRSRRHHRRRRATHSPAFITPLAAPTSRCAQTSGPTRKRRTSRCRDGSGESRVHRDGFSCTNERRLLDEGLLGFIVCILGAAACFFVAFITLPFLALRPAKFALAFR